MADTAMAGCPMSSMSPKKGLSAFTAVPRHSPIIRSKLTKRKSIPGGPNPSEGALAKTQLFLECSAGFDSGQEGLRGSMAGTWGSSRS